MPAPIPVLEQALPDPDFPTVDFPNPEEGQGVWKLAFTTAEAKGLNLVLANDPDADRFAAAERDPQTGQGNDGLQIWCRQQGYVGCKHSLCLLHCVQRRLPWDLL